MDLGEGEVDVKGVALNVSKTKPGLWNSKSD